MLLLIKNLDFNESAALTLLRSGGILVEVTSSTRSAIFQATASRSLWPQPPPGASVSPSTTTGKKN